MPDENCTNCRVTVRVINYALGPMLMHVDPHASFPTEHKGTAWRYCRTEVATLEPPARGVDALIPPPPERPPPLPDPVVPDTGQSERA